MKNFKELFETKFKELLILLIVTNLLTGITTSSKRVVQFFLTPIENKENIVGLKNEVESLKTTVDKMNDKFDAIIKSNNIVLKSEKDDIFVNNNTIALKN